MDHRNRAPGRRASQRARAGTAAPGVDPHVARQVRPAHQPLGGHRRHRLHLGGGEQAGLAVPRRRELLQHRHLVGVAGGHDRARLADPEPGPGAQLDPARPRPVARRSARPAWAVTQPCPKLRTDAPTGRSSRSTIVTDRPRSRASAAWASPTTPAPTTTRSDGGAAGPSAVMARRWRDAPAASTFLGSGPGRAWTAPHARRQGRRHPMIELVALDMAGTTIDEHGDVYEALRQVVVEQGAEVDDALLRQFMGTDKRHAIAAMTLAGGGATPRRGRRAAVRAVPRPARGALPGRPPEPVAGVPEALAELRDAGVRVALTTGFAGDVVEPLLASLGWAVGDELIDAVVCADDVNASRPAPYMVFRAMERTKVIAVDAVLVAGDTPGRPAVGHQRRGGGRGGRRHRGREPRRAGPGAPHPPPAELRGAAGPGGRPVAGGGRGGRMPPMTTDRMDVQRRIASARRRSSPCCVTRRATWPSTARGCCSRPTGSRSPPRATASWSTWTARRSTTSPSASTT